MDVISPELPQFMRLLIALAIVLALMGGLSFFLKKLGLSTQTHVKGGDSKRLKVLETLPLDARRRLAIIQCDDKEHLIILGANSELVIDKDLHPVDSSSSGTKSS
ncbi:MAG: FliO/MopB family protein [Alphaproteobacteria bacterium]